MSLTRNSRRPVLTVASLAAVLSLGLTACGQGAGEPAESPTPSSSPAESSAGPSASASPDATESASASASGPATASESASGPASASPSASSPATSSGSPSGSAGATPSATASPSASAPASPSAAPSSATPSATPSAIDSPDDEVTVYWVAVAGSGRPGIEFPGCGDLLFEDTVTVGDSSGPVGDVDRVEAGIELLLGTGYDVPGGFVNALHQSTLEVRDASIEADTVTVELTGQPVSAGTCDDPRIISQLEYSARANAGTAAAEILIDGVPIQEFMSQRG